MVARNNVMGLLAAADKRNGFPAGTMASVMQQEIGGNNKYLDDPTAYHYAANDKGQRIAGHTGKVSTAFGPFGILESTAAKPGYGVAPLKDKSLEEQVRFASDYLAGRSKSAGGLSAGLAGYGEGEKYSREVMGRINMQTYVPRRPVPTEAVAPVQMEATKPVQSPIQMAQASVAPIPQEIAPVAQAPQQIAQGIPEQIAQGIPEQGVDPWLAFQEGMRQKQQVAPSDLAYAPQMPVTPDFMAAVGGTPTVATPQFQGYQRPDRSRAMALLRQIGAIG